MATNILDNKVKKSGDINITDEDKNKSSNEIPHEEFIKMDTTPVDKKDFSAMKQGEDLPEEFLEDEGAEIPHDEFMRSIKTEKILNEPLKDEEREPLGEIITSVPRGLSQALNTYSNVGRFFGVPGSDWLHDVAGNFEDLFPATREDLVTSGISGGISSTINSISTGAPGAVLGGLAGSPSGPGLIGTATLGYATSSATFMGISEYMDFLDEVEEKALTEGAEQRDIEAIRREWKDEALVAGLAETGFEFAGNLAMAKFLKLIGGKAVSQPAKRALAKALAEKLGTKKFSVLLKRAGKGFPFELSSELATTGIQIPMRQKAGTTDMSVEEGLKRTIIPTAVQSFLPIGGLSVASKLSGKPTVENVEKKINETFDEMPDVDTKSEAVAYGLKNRNDPFKIAAVKLRLASLERKLEDSSLFEEELDISGLSEEHKQVVRDKELKIGETTPFNKRKSDGSLTKLAVMPEDKVGVKTLVKQLSDKIGKDDPLVKTAKELMKGIPYDTEIFISEILENGEINRDHGLRTRSGEIVLNKERMNDRGSREILDTVVHEVAHGYTSAIMNDSITRLTGRKKSKSEIKFKEAIEDIFETVEKDLTPENVLKRAEGLSLKKDAFTTLKDLKTMLSNPEEFLSYALTNQDFQQLLSTVNYKTENKSIWQKIVESVKEVLNIKTENTAFGAVFETTGDFFNTEHLGNEISEMGNLLGVLSGMTGLNYKYSNEKGIHVGEFQDKEYEAIISALEDSKGETTEVIEGVEFKKDRTIPVTYIGDQKTLEGKKIPLYNLQKDIPGHPEGSTVTKETLEELGLDIVETKESGEGTEFNNILDDLNIKKKEIPLKTQWARTQVDRSAWLRYFAGLGPSPEVPSSNRGYEYDADILGGEPLNLTDKEYRSMFGDPKEISWLARKFMSPEKMAENTAASLYSAKLIEAELHLHRLLTKYETWWKKLKHGLNKEERIQCTKAMELAYQLRNGDYLDKSKAKKALTELYAKYPKIVKAIEGVKEEEGITSKGGLIEIFEYIKERYKNSLYETEFAKLSSVDQLMVERTIAAKTKDQDITRVLRNNLRKHTNIKREALIEYDKKHTEGAYLKLTNEEETKVVEKYTQKRIKELSKVVERLTEIDNWGVRDYITKIEEGSYRITDRDGNTYGFAKTLKEGRKEAYRVRKAYEKKGEDIGMLNVKPSINRVNPTKERKGVLLGAEDIFEILPKYLYTMEKRIHFDPIIEAYNKAVRDNPERFPLSLRNVLQDQIKAVKGYNYSWMDKVYDDIATKKGWRTGGYSRAVNRVRSVMANVLLGYRPSAAFINLAGGFGNTWVKVGLGNFSKAAKVLATGKYVDPTGTERNVRDMIQEIKDSGVIGLDLAVMATGDIDPNIKLWQPLGLFQLPETAIRPHTFMANYIYQREDLNKGHFDAKEAAAKAIRFQQFTYNMAALPEILRSPTGKMVGQFKTYLVKELEFMSSLRGKEVARMVGLQLALAGPRGVVYMLKSIPILGALGILNDWEEWMVRDKGKVADAASRGIGGLVGADISAPAVMQFPHRPEDWAGPFLSAAISLFKEVIIPNLESTSPGVDVAYKTEDVVDWGLSLSPLMYYLQDFYDSAMLWEVKEGGVKKILKNMQMPNVWVRDSAGNKAYKVSTLWDRILLLSGVAPVQKTRAQVLERTWMKEVKARQNNRNKWYRKVNNRLLRGKSLTSDLMLDGLLYGIDPNNIPNAYKYSQMKPEEREVMKANLFEKAEAIDHFMLMEE